jgi:large subunit ribosomal protein L23
MDAMKVLIEPVLTEKTNTMREGETRKYVFKVDPRANKYRSCQRLRNCLM